MKAVLSQINPIIGNFRDNLALMQKEIRWAEQQGAQLVIFPELSICGYPPQDLLEYASFIESSRQALDSLARSSSQTGILVGAPTRNPESTGKNLYNSAYFLFGGKIEQVFHKTLLPTYDIFDEYRYFESNRDFHLLEFKGLKIAVTICEDLWFDQPTENAFSNSRLYTVNPLEKLKALGPDLVINLAASPFSYLRQELKTGIFTENARNFELPILYLNQVGAQTELIFEGGSLVVDRRGRITDRLKMFAEDRKVVDLNALKHDQMEASEGEQWPEIRLIYHGLKLGLRDYFIKMGFSKAILGLSGGIDSAVTLVIATAVLGPENVHALLMPSAYSSDHSIDDARQLADHLGISFNILSIQEIFESFNASLAPIFRDLPEDITEENLQSRIRGTLLMAYSNKFGHILLNTSNKSEAAVGYGTLYGDMAGGLSVLGDVYKTDVYKLAEWINAQPEQLAQELGRSVPDGGLIPRNIIEKPPSAELKPDQKDTDSLPDYAILDPMLFAYIEQQKSVDEIVAEGHDRALCTRILGMVNRNEYKRYQTPPILRISSKAFGVGRRMPLVARY